MRFDLPITIHQPIGLERWLARMGVCAYCRQHSLQLKYAANGFEWRQCKRCIAVFVTPIQQELLNGVQR